MSPSDATAPSAAGGRGPAAQGFHPGELSVQRRAGLGEKAARLAGMLTEPDLSGGMSRFAAGRDLAVLTSRDDQGRLWTSALYGQPGFCRAHGGTLTVGSVPVEGDPLHILRPGEHGGALLIDFDRRRRLRVNGTLVDVLPSGFAIKADQAFGNCSQYIQQRRLATGAHDDTGDVAVLRSEEFLPGDINLIGRADTMILGTAHPTRGADTSHRGGTPGFVRIDGDSLWWPDYPGNNLFNSMGNIVESPATSLLFFDFAASSTLQLSGRACLEWTTPGMSGDDGWTGRRIRFTPEQVVRITHLPFQVLGYKPYAKNHPLT
jgi:uncharacterized protein